MNYQKPEPVVSAQDSHLLDLHSMFYTLQGEGPFSGQRAVFVRFAGCNLQCPGCDTLYTEGRRLMSVPDLVEMVKYKIIGQDARMLNHLVVITGGEPLRQGIGKFVKELLVQGFRVQIESNGTIAPDAELQRLFQIWSASHLLLVVSPKTKKIHPVNQDLADVFKYVLKADSVDVDGLPKFALEHEAGKGVARPRDNTHIYLTPFDDADHPENNAANLQAVAESCLEYGYTANIQLHKLFKLP